MEEVINSFTELKKWKKAMLIVMIALICTGCMVTVFGIIMEMYVLMPILGGVIALCGAGVYMFARYTVKKTEKTIVDYLQSSPLPEEQVREIMERIKA